MVQHFSLGRHLQSNTHGFEVEVDWKNTHQSDLSSQTASVKPKSQPHWKTIWDGLYYWYYFVFLTLFQNIIGKTTYHL